MSFLFGGGSREDKLKRLRAERDKLVSKLAYLDQQRAIKKARDDQKYARAIAKATDEKSISEVKYARAQEIADQLGNEVRRRENLVKALTDKRDLETEQRTAYLKEEISLKQKKKAEIDKQIAYESAQLKAIINSNAYTRSKNKKNNTQMLPDVLIPGFQPFDPNA